MYSYDAFREHLERLTSVPKNAQVVISKAGQQMKAPVFDELVALDNEASGYCISRKWAGC